METVPVGLGSGTLPGACPGEDEPDAGTTAGAWAPDTAPAAVWAAGAPAVSGAVLGGGAGVP